MSKNYLWNWDSHTDDLHMAIGILTLSIHRVDDRRARHLAVWIQNSQNPIASLAFIKSNINCTDFHPFANPWVSDEIDIIFKKTNGTKILRLSTRVAGALTLSNTNGISASKRFNVADEGVIIGNFKFTSTADLMYHITSRECCFCLSTITDETSSILKCGHVFHTLCLDKNRTYSENCPFCRHVSQESCRIPNGKTCRYIMCSSLDSININPSNNFT